MLYSVKSNSKDYSRIQLNLDIPWKCNYVKYYVSSINTKANILSTTKDDYLLFDYQADAITKQLRIEFDDMYAYSFSYLVKHLNKCQQLIEFNNDNNRTITLKPSVNLTFIEGSHRAKLITGFYDTSTGYKFEKNVEVNVPDLPILDFANKFYLVSLQGQAVHSTIRGEEYTPSVIANIDSMYMDNEALIVNYDQAKPIKIKCNTDSLKYLEMRLVDFMFHPVILKSPLFITIKIKPANDADVKAIVTK